MLDDERIIALFLRRDEQAIKEVGAKYEAYCFSIANRILTCPEDAMECVNDAYLAAWNSIPPHQPKVLATYLGKLTRRISLMKWRSARAEKRGGGEVPLALQELLECIPDDNSPEAALQQQELTEILNDFLSALSKIPRQVFLYRYWHLESIADISKRFGFSQSKVKSMLHRTRGKLLLRLKKEGIIHET